MSKDGLVSKAKKLTVKPSTPVPSLSSGAAGTEITINGTNFGDQQGSSTVTFGTVPATKIGPWAHDSIRVTVPDGVKKGQPNNIVVTVKNVQSDAADFTVP